MPTYNERPKREDIVLKKKNKKTIVYFVSLQTQNSIHDRTTRFKNCKPNICFFDWLQNQRKEIEELKGSSATVVNCNRFEFETIES